MRQIQPPGWKSDSQAGTGDARSRDMPASHFILLIETDPDRTGPLATQLVRFGVEPIRVRGLDEAVDLLKSKQYAVSAVLLPVDLPADEVAEALKTMRRDEPVLPCMAYGKTPEPAQRKRLRQAGVQLSLWDGYDAGILRFQINRLVSGEDQHAVRGARRAPIHTPVRIEIGGREKEGILYSIAEGGCFIETPRAIMDGARLRLTFVVEERNFEIDGIVAFANVPGNLQRPNLTLGMGVRFESLSQPDQERLAEFIQERMESLEV